MYEVGKINLIPKNFHYFSNNHENFKILKDLGYPNFVFSVIVSSSYCLGYAVIFLTQILWLKLHKNVLSLTSKFGQHLMEFGHLIYKNM